MACLCQKILHSVSNQRNYEQRSIYRTLEKDTSKYRGSIYALSMVIHCPNYTCRIPNVSPRLIFEGLIFRNIFELG